MPLPGAMAAGGPVVTGKKRKRPEEGGGGGGRRAPPGRPAPTTTRVATPASTPPPTTTPAVAPPPSNWLALKARLGQQPQHKRAPREGGVARVRPHTPTVAPTTTATTTPLPGAPGISHRIHRGSAHAGAGAVPSTALAIASYASAVLGTAPTRHPAITAPAVPTAPVPTDTAAAAHPLPTHTSGPAPISDDPAAKRAALGPFTDMVLTTEQKRYVALDCEMVGVGNEGYRSQLAQVVVVDFAGRVLYDAHVLPVEPVTDYRTAVSGIKPEHLRPGHAKPFAEVQKAVAALTTGRIIVGHALHNDLRVLLLSHASRHIRDTAKWQPYRRRIAGGKWRPQRLRSLAEQYLHIRIQTGEHEPAEDAQAAMALYRLRRREWELWLRGYGLDGKRLREKAGRRERGKTGMVDGEGGAAAADASEGDDASSDSGDEVASEDTDSREADTQTNIITSRTVSHGSPAADAVKARAS